MSNPGRAHALSNRMGMLRLNPRALSSFGIPVVRLCSTCNARYASGSICDACLRDADSDADASRKRAILFPADFAALT